ncbi:MAG: hypothetical protein WBG41_00225 [Acidimicrobiales bacterium]
MAAAYRCPYPLPAGRSGRRPSHDPCPYPGPIAIGIRTSTAVDRSFASFHLTTGCTALSFVVAVVVAGLATATALSPTPSSSAADTARGPTTLATSAEKGHQVGGLAADAATASGAYRSVVAADGNRMLADLTHLGDAVDRGDLTGARAAELDVQADFDEIREVDAASPQNVASLDGLAGEVPPGATFGGLHALERDLWTTGNPATDLPSVEVQASVANYVVANQSLAPSTIVATAVAELGWVVEQAIPEREELYSHHDDVDIAAGVTAAQQAFSAVRPLACSLDASGCQEALAALGTLEATVAALGPPADVPDSLLTPPVQHDLSEETDRAADALAALDAPLLPFGTAGPQPYGAAGPAN